MVKTTAAPNTVHKNLLCTLSSGREFLLRDLAASSIFIKFLVFLSNIDPGCCFYEKNKPRQQEYLSKSPVRNQILVNGATVLLHLVGGIQTVLR